MASAACVNALSPESFPATPTYACLTPRVSFAPDAVSDGFPMPKKDQPQPVEGKPDPDPSAGEFEFCLEDPVAMLPADELFSNGKLVPLHVSVPKAAARAAAASPDTEERRRMSDVSAIELYLSSPKAPRCSSRWRELLGLKKLANRSGAESTAASRRNSSSTSSSSNVKSIKHFLQRGSKASDSSSINTPLLKESESDSVIVSSRLSLSSSSSSGGYEHEDLARLSLDSDKPHSVSLHKNPNSATIAPRMRLVKPRADNPAAVRSPARKPAAVDSGDGVSPRIVSVDSPRMNSSGKVIFQSLERSSSSPSSFNGGPRFKHRGMERSYSAGVHVTPVLNVPVSSLMGSGSVFGFGPLFSASSPHKRDGNSSGISSSRGHGHIHNQQIISSRSSNKL